MPDYLQRYINIFFTLSTCRYPSQYNIGPIPWTAINEYALRYHIVDEQFEVLSRFLEVLQLEYMKWIKDQQKKGNDDG